MQLICVPLKISTYPGSLNDNSAQRGMSHRGQGGGRAGPINPSLGFSAPCWTIARQEANATIGSDIQLDDNQSVNPNPYEDATASAYTFVAINGKFPSHSFIKGQVLLCEYDA